MGTYDTRGGSPIGPKIDAPDPSPLEDAVFDVLEAAGVAIEVIDRTLKVISDYEAALEPAEARPAAPVPPAMSAAEPDEPRRPWPDPTENMLASDRFERVWQCIKRWDINVPDVYVGYMGSTGNHVRAILDALDAAPAPSARWTTRR